MESQEGNFQFNMEANAVQITAHSWFPKEPSSWNMGLKAPSHGVGKRTAPVGPLAAFVLRSVFVLVVLFGNLTPLQATLG